MEIRAVLVEKQAYKSSTHLDIVGTKILEADEGIPIAGRKYPSVLVHALSNAVCII